MYAGLDTVVINYRYPTGGLPAEVLTLRDGLVVSGSATHRPLPV